MPRTVTTYAATKAGVAHLAEGLRAELAGGPIAVSVIYPGYIRSEMNERVKNAPFMVSTEGVRAMVEAIEKEKPHARVPAWPWVPLGAAMRHLPLPLAEGSWAEAGVSVPAFTAVQGQVVREQMALRDRRNSRLLTNHATVRLGDSPRRGAQAVCQSPIRFPSGSLKYAVKPMSPTVCFAMPSCRRASRSTRARRRCPRRRP